MIKPNKRKSTKKYTNLISNIQPLTSDQRGIIVGVAAHSDPHSRGITLVALIITIIVMLILVGVSVTMAIKGDLFGITKRAAKRTEKEKNIEQELSTGRVKIDDTWYDSLEDYIGGNPSKDQNESNIIFIYEPKGWTNGKVKVKIESKEDKGQLQYRMDGATWTNYTEEIEVENNGTRIYAREVNDIEEEVETVVDKIDTEDPEITITSPSQTQSSINLKIVVTDNLSGISKIEWYYKKDTDPESEYAKNKTTNEYKTMNGTEVGKTEVEEPKTISGLEKGTTYNIKVVVFDVAGNKAESVLEQPTIASLLGKSATIDGKKYIVLYEPGEKIQIGDTEYEIEEVQLISKSIMDSIYLGKNDMQVYWTNNEVIEEADIINKNDSLDNLEKAIYSYNNAIETLNKRCESLVDMSNPDILSVRSVGSNPIDPKSENDTRYSLTFLDKNPSDSSKGKCNGIGKSTDENYLTDYNRMQELGISQLVLDYCLASRFVNFSGGIKVTFYMRYVRSDGSLQHAEVWGVGTVSASGYDYYASVRPVVSIKSDAISKYLD